MVISVYLKAGILKVNGVANQWSSHRYSDFQVNEVDSQGQIIAVTNQIIPDDPEEIPGEWRGLFATLYWGKFQMCCTSN